MEFAALKDKKLMAVEAVNEVTGKTELMLMVDGKLTPVKITTRCTVELEGFDEVFGGSGDPFEVLSQFAAAYGKVEERIEIPEDKRWRGLMKFSGDTSFSVSANKPNSSWTGGK